MIIFKQKYLKYKQKYLLLKNQKGCGWILKFDTSTGEPYYQNGDNIQKGWSKRKKINDSNSFEIPQVLIIPSPNSNWKSEDYDDYYDNDTGDFNLINKNDGKLFFSSFFQNNGEPWGKNAKLLWEIKTPEELGLIEEKEIFDINIPLKNITGDELSKIIENNKSLNPDGINDYSLNDDNFYLPLGSTIRNKENKIFRPNRFLIRKEIGGAIKVYPTLYLENVNDLENKQKELITINISNEINHWKEHNNDHTKISIHRKKVFEDKIKNNSSIWIYLTYFILNIKETKEKVNIHLSYGYSDFLISGYGKVVTCFIVKYFKEKYPDKEIIYELDDRTNGVWRDHGFEYIGDRNAKMTYNFEKGQEICKDVVKNFNCTEFLYYELNMNN